MRRTRRRPRTLGFVVLLLFIAVNAAGGGVYGLIGAPGVPRHWLRGSPFSSYLVPGIILLVVVGGVHLVAAIMVLRRNSRAAAVAAVAGLVLLGWIGVQVAMIGYVSWLQPAMAILAVITLAQARRLHEGVRSHHS